MKKLLLLVASLAVCVSANASEWGVKAGASISTSTMGIDAVSAKIKLGSTVGYYVGATNNISFNDKIGLQTELVYRSAGSSVGVSSDMSTLANLVLSDYMSEFDDDFQFALDDMKVTYRTHEVDLPILFKYKPTENLSLLAGPFLSYSVASTVKFNDGVEDLISGLTTEAYVDLLTDTGKSILDEVVKQFDMGLSFGLEYSFDCGLFIDARYSVGLLNQFNNVIDLDNIEVLGESMEGAGTFDIEDTLGFKGTLRTQFFQVGVGFRF
ncbi:MAG: porin family protein [Rikenellaceae bacterium]